MSDVKLKESKTVLKIDDNVERKLSEEEFFEKIFMSEFSKFPQAIQDALVMKQVSDMEQKSAKEEIESLLKSGTLDRKEKMRLKLKKKIMDKDIAK
jgi:hypothetical protein